MNKDMIIKKTTVWGNYCNFKNSEEKIRLMKKKQILEMYPFVDHYTIYAYKPKNQKGPAKEKQTFILSYAYNYDSFANEEDFINKLVDIELLFHKEKCLYKNHDAYKIFIYENILPIDEILHQI